jgi:hypothetical protein
MILNGLGSKVTGWMLVEWNSFSRCHKVSLCFKNSHTLLWDVTMGFFIVIDVKTSI